MSPYIVNLTNHLIDKNDFDEVFCHIGFCIDSLDDFVKHVKINLLHGDVKDMSPGTLGKIMCALEIGDVATTHPGKEVLFAGDCGEMLRELVSLCLAYVIRDRLNPSKMADPEFPLSYCRSPRNWIG
mgnify:CR=1 FL=1